MQLYVLNKVSRVIDLQFDDAFFLVVLDQRSGGDTCVIRRHDGQHFKAHRSSSSDDFKFQSS